MRAKQWIKVSALMIVVLLSLTVHIVAFSDNFETEDIAVSQKSIYLENIDFQTIAPKQITTAFTCFDVAEDGTFVLGFDTEPVKQIGVYSADGVLQKMYSFQTSGAFLLQWDGENLQIYFVRSSLVMYINADGQCTQLWAIPITTQNNNKWNDLQKQRPISIGETTYTAKNDNGLKFFSFSYSKLIKKDGTSQETILYDASKEYSAKVIVCLIIIVSFFAISVAAFIFSRNLMQKRNK